MTSSPRFAPSSLSRISCSTGTLSLKSITFRPASSASIASENACGPGTETSERFAAVRRAADPVVRGGGAAPRPAEPDPPAEDRASAASSSALPRVIASSSSARIATSRSLGPAPSGASKPMPSRRSRLSSVPIATSAACTPSTVETDRLTCIRVTESW